MAKKLMNFRIEEETYEKLKKICNKKGKNMTDVLKELINDFIKKNEYLLIDTDKEEKFIIFTNMLGEYEEFETTLTEEDLDKIIKETREEQIEAQFKNEYFDFKQEFEKNKAIYALKKLAKMKLDEDWSIISTTTQGVFQFIKDGKYLYDKFNAFVFDKDKNLIIGDPFTLALVKFKNN
jgi:predicted DNA-binding protein